MNFHNDDSSLNSEGPLIAARRCEQQTFDSIEVWRERANADTTIRAAFPKGNTLRILRPFTPQDIEQRIGLVWSLKL
jgi:hypothetical protein